MRSLLLLALAAALVASTPEATETCIPERAAFDEATERFHEGIDDIEGLLGAARGLRACPEVSEHDIEQAYRWSVFILLNLPADETTQIERAGRALGELEAYRKKEAGNQLPGWYFSERSRALQVLSRHVEAIEAARLALQQEMRTRDRVTVMRRLGWLLLYTGDSEAAVDVLSRAVTEAEAGIDEPLWRAATYRYYAQALTLTALRQARRDHTLFARAQEQLQLALAELDRMGPDVSGRDVLTAQFHRAGIFSGLASARQGAGEDEKAVEAARKTVAIARDVSAERLTFSLIMLGSTLRANGQLAESEHALLEALGWAAGDPVLLEDIHDQLAQTYDRLGEILSAEHHYRLATRLRIAAGERLGASELAVRAFNVGQWGYHFFVAFLLGQGRYEEAFTELDATRVRALRTMRRLGAAEALEPDLRAELDRLQEERRHLRSELHVGGSDAALEARLAGVEAELARIPLPEVDREPLDIRTLQEQLAPDGRVLVSYFIAAESYALVVSADHFEAVSLPSSEDDLWEAVAGLRNEGGFSLDQVAVEAEPLRVLYDAVFAPIEHLVPEGRPVTIIPDGPLAMVPFGMLVAGETPRFRYERWPFLILRNPIATELAADLIGEERKASAEQPLVAFGRTWFSENDRVSAAVASPPPPLPYVATELGAIRRRVPAGTFVLDEDATPGRLLSLIEDARVVHLASHLYVSPERPLYSSVLLSPDESGGGTVYLYDLIGRHFSPELVVLSACDSGQGRIERGEGIIGLHYAFRAAGAGASLATLWPVDDRATAFLMGRFYRHLARGLTKDVALQQAQVDFLDAHAGLDASPFYWAAFVLSGDPSPVDLGGRGTNGWVWLLGGLGLITAGLVVARRRHGRW